MNINNLCYSIVTTMKKGAVVRRDERDEGGGLAEFFVCLVGNQTELNIIRQLSFLVLSPYGVERSLII